MILIAFNRPAPTRRVFERLATIRPKQLFVVLDGPRPNRPSDRALCSEVLEIVSQPSWPCHLEIQRSEENLGCKRRVASGISWAFERVGSAVILEDDCLPDPSFFRFAEELLEKFRDDLRVMHISGVNFQPDAGSGQDSYYFSQIPHIWGWATWRRAWAQYDLEMRDWKMARDAGLLRDIFVEPRSVATWTSILDQVSLGAIDTWDYQWCFACWLHRGLSITPGSNLVSNIGFGEGATHTLDPSSRLADLPTRPIEDPILHPPAVTRDRARDCYTEKHIFNARPSIVTLLRRKFKLILPWLKS